MGIILALFVSVLGFAIGWALKSKFNALEKRMDSLEDRVGGAEAALERQDADLDLLFVDSEEEPPAEVAPDSEGPTGPSVG